MMRFGKIVTLAALLLLPRPASADETSCLPDRPVVDRGEIWDFSRVTKSDFFLPTRSAYQWYETYAAAHLEFNKRLHVLFDYKTPSGTVGLEYSFYRVEIQVGHDYDPDRFVYVNDLTRDCMSPGRSIYPGQSIRLDPIKIPPRGDGSPRGREFVRVRIWGHL